MRRGRYLLICFLLLGYWAGAQEDTTPRRDTPVKATVQPRHTPRPRPVVRTTSPVQDTALQPLDSVNKLAVDSATLAVDSNLVPPPVVMAKRFDSLIYANHPFYHFQNPMRRMESVRVQNNGKEELFYCVVGLLLLFALLRNGFGRYLQDLFRLFFRSSLKQRQAKEQLMEAYFPSLMLNLLFVLSGALFLNLILAHFRLGLNFSFWMLFLYCAAGLAAIYIVKFITLKICGWIFRLMDATDTYTFIVFTTNKVVGIALLPFIILLAFTSGTVSQVAFTLSLLLVGALYLYRYFLSYVSLQRQVKLNLFHFALYLAAFEIVPLLLINKLLLHFLG